MRRPGTSALFRYYAVSVAPSAATTLGRPSSSTSTAFPSTTFPQRACARATELTKYAIVAPERSRDQA